jgi:hypothetical protein
MAIDLTKLKRLIFGRQVTVDLPAQTRAYRTALASPDGKRNLLPDLIHYTGVLAPAPLHGDAFAQGRVQGRRDVGLHILENLHLQPMELYAILKGQPIITPEDFQQ